MRPASRYNSQRGSQASNSLNLFLSDRRCLSPTSANILFSATWAETVHHSRYFPVIKSREKVILSLRKSNRRRASLKQSLSSSPPNELRSPLFTVQSYSTLASEAMPARLLRTQRQNPRKQLPRSATQKEIKNWAELRVG